MENSSLGVGELGLLQPKVRDYEGQRVPNGVMRPPAPMVLIVFFSVSTHKYQAGSFHQYQQ